MQRLHVFFSLALLATLGCSAPPPSTPVADNRATRELEPSEPANQTVSLKLVTPEELSAELKARRGKIVLVDMWATW